MIKVGEWHQQTTYWRYYIQFDQYAKEYMTIYFPNPKSIQTERQSKYRIDISGGNLYSLVRQIYPNFWHINYPTLEEAKEQAGKYLKLLKLESFI